MFSTRGHDDAPYPPATITIWGVATMSLTEKICACLKDDRVEYGIAVKHIESGEEVLIHADEPFPTASVFKVPVMVEVFKQAREGRFDLNDRLELAEADKTLTTGVLLHLQPGLMLTIRDLLVLMNIVSDNTATTMLLKLVGAHNVEASMHALGLGSMHVKMTVHDMFLHAFGIPDRPTISVGDLIQVARGTPMDYNSRTFSRGAENNVSSARDMTRLMCLLYAGEVLDRQACDEMLTILRSQQYNGRVPRYLPWYSVGHKTGTMRGLRNDSGIIYIDDANHAAFSVFSFDSTPLALGDTRLGVSRELLVEEVMGEIGLAIHAHYGGAE
jgi:beta-lactamase class A